LLFEFMKEVYNAHEKSRKQKYLVNYCVLTWFILFWINGRDTLLLQFIKTYVLFRMSFASYWCLEPPSGRDCRESIFATNETKLLWEGACCLVHSRRAAGEHTNMGLSVWLPFRQIGIWFCVATVNTKFLAE